MKPTRAAPGRGLVVFVVPDFEPTIGGTTRQAANEAGALIARGYDAVVLTQRIDRSWPRDERRNGVRVVRVGPSSRGPIAMKLLDLRVAMWLRRRRNSIAIVHVIMYPDFAMAAVAAGCGRRTVMVWAGSGDATDTLARDQPAAGVDQPTAGVDQPAAGVDQPAARGKARPSVRAVLRTLRRRRLRRGVTHVALTEAMAAEVAAAIGGPRPEVIPTPVDTERYAPPDGAARNAARAALGVAAGETAVVYAGHLRASKRVDRLVAALQRLHTDAVPARLFVLGDSRIELDDCSVALTRQVAEAGLSDRVVFTGGVPDVRPYLRAADVFVLPSEREGLSNALLEALACGVPCVAPASAGGDQVLDSTCGAVPESGEPDDLAAAIRSLTDPADWSELSRGARMRAEKYSVSAVSGTYERLYARIGLSGFETSR